MTSYHSPSHSLSTRISYCRSFPKSLMARRLFKGKGKRKASPSPSPSLASVEESDSDVAPLAHKKIRLRSPARVKQVALAKVASKTGSSSKGLAGFAALVNNANLSAARAETSHGLRSGSSSSRFRAGIKSKNEKMVSCFFSYMNTHIMFFLALG